MVGRLASAYNGSDGGCFGTVGPGALGFADGLWELEFNSGYLEPLVNYSVRFVLSKDIREASDSVAVFVERPIQPTIEIRYTLIKYHDMWSLGRLVD